MWPLRMVTIGTMAPDGRLGGTVCGMISDVPDFHAIVPLAVRP